MTSTGERKALDRIADEVAEGINELAEQVEELDDDRVSRLREELEAEREAENTITNIEEFDGRGDELPAIYQRATSAVYNRGVGVSDAVTEAADHFGYELTRSSQADLETFVKRAADRLEDGTDEVLRAFSEWCDHQTN